MPSFERLRIIFLGTPDFAVATLDALVAAGGNVVAVVTAPDKPAGRGMHLQQSPVKQYAVAHQIPVLQPEKLKNPEFLQTLQSFKADIQVVVAFRMLPLAVWDMPPFGTINVHGSLLPQYRGAAPINWAIINGETQTGVTTFQLQHAIDTGAILLQTTIPISPNETAGSLHDHMKMIGANTLVATLQQFCAGSLTPKPQDTPNEERKLKVAPKIFTETCKIQPENTAEQVCNLVRGLSPFPGAFTTIGGKMLKVYMAGLANEGLPLLQAGKFACNGEKLWLQCANGAIQLLEVQLEGKKKMPIAAFLRGFKWQQQPDIQTFESLSV